MNWQAFIIKIDACLVTDNQCCYGCGKKNKKCDDKGEFIMKNNKILCGLFTLLFAVGVMTVLVGCNNDDTATPAPTPPPTNAPAEEAPTEEAGTYDDVYEDLQYVLSVVSENLDWGDTMWEQIMLADDVPSPEMKYGLLVVPFFPSDAVLRNTRTVSINNGNFEIEIVSAETGLSWFINQDGVIRGGN